jgi:hypothetical protein
MTDNLDPEPLEPFLVQLSTPINVTIGHNPGRMRIVDND